MNKINFRLTTIFFILIISFNNCSKDGFSAKKSTNLSRLSPTPTPEPYIPPGSAPSWFVNMPTGTWTTVASAVGERIRDVLPIPLPNAVYDSPAAIITAWTGAAVDQVRGEYLMVANGGHADYSGNEGYGISLREENPKWRRLSDPTPNNMMTNVINGPGGYYDDGRPRAMHSTYQCFGDGKIWYPMQNSVASGSGGNYNGVVAYNRDMLGSALTPLPWTIANLGPWEIYSPPFPVGSYTGGAIFGECAFDPVTKKVWAMSGNSANYSVYWSVETAGPNIGKSTTYAANIPWVGNWGGWYAMADDLRILIASEDYTKSITVLNLESPSGPGAVVQIPTTNVTGDGIYNNGSGGVYIRKNHTVAVGNPKLMGNAVRKLQIPTKVVSGKTVYDPAGTWAWTTLNPGGVPIADPLNGLYTKWNIIEDMGNGQSAVVVTTSIDGPTHIYKIPIGGL